MESPPMSSAWSGLSSEDSGLLLLTSDSLSSCSSNWQFTMESVESEEDQKSLSSDHDSLELFDQFNTVKKGKAVGVEPIEPPLEFQDEPGVEDEEGEAEAEARVKRLASRLVEGIVEEAVMRSVMTSTARLCCTPEPVPASSLARRPASRNSLSSRLSSSHNSLSVPAANKADDSSFITSAMSHDVLTDMYNVPFDSDIYTLPVDSLRPSCPQRPKRHHRHHRKRRKHTADTEAERGVLAPDTSLDVLACCPTPAESKRHSVPGTSGRAGQPCEPIHMTLQEVRQFLHNLYSTPHDSRPPPGPRPPETAGPDRPPPAAVRKHRKNTFAINIKHRKSRGHSETEETLCMNNNNNNNSNINNNNNDKGGDRSADKLKKASSHGKNSFSYTLKQTLCNIFRFRRAEPAADTVLVLGVPRVAPFTKRALPPLPSSDGAACETPDEERPDDAEEGGEEATMDFASSIEKVKDYGWYWGPISGETAEKILSNEPDGSFIVRDSSDDHYIFSLTFKLNAVVRHVRIEHDQGNFSFGSCTKFKSHTIVEFIENAVEHSRSGRYLFFLHRRPVHGPMRVQLLHPVSRFKQVQSLQHMCRFAILKVVRRDLIPALPLPRRIIDYLSSPHYYSEHPSLDDKHPASSPSLHVFSFMPPNS